MLAPILAWLQIRLPGKESYPSAHSSTAFPSFLVLRSPSSKVWSPSARGKPTHPLDFRDSGRKGVENFSA